MNIQMLPYGKQYIDEDDIKAVKDVLGSDFLTTGPAVAGFEEAFCEVTGAKHAIVCNNGTAALHMAALAAGFGQEKGQVAIVPSITFLATANAVRFTGADVVFCDVDPQTGLMRAEDFEAALAQCAQKKLTPKAVFPVHLAGQCVDLKAIKEIAEAQNVSVIADSCHVLGGEYRNSPVGSCVYEDMATFSFHPVKTIAMGEGGAVTTNDDQVADYLRTLRTHGMTPRPDKGPWVYDMEKIGFNYRASDIHCALGTSQLAKLEDFVQKRRHLVSLYNRALKGLSEHIQIPETLEYNTPSWHLYALRIDFEALGQTRAEAMGALKEQGVGTQVHYIPVHSQPYYKRLYGDLNLPGAQAYYEKTLSFPLFYTMDEKDVERVVEAIKTVFKL